MKLGGGGGGERGWGEGVGRGGGRRVGRGGVNVGVERGVKVGGESGEVSDWHWREWGWGEATLFMHICGAPVVVPTLAIFLL